MYFSSTFVSSAILALVSASTINKRAFTGQATYYTGNLAGGTCSFATYTLPSGIFGTALSDSNWGNADNCGACISVTGPSGSTITAMIVDECPGCGTNHLDLFPDAFSSLADPTKGVIDVSWDFIDCPFSSPLELHNKNGVSAYWFSMQVVNANKRVTSLDVSTDGGNTWQGTTRQTYNFFENPSGFGTTTVDIKVTSFDGDVVIVNNVEISSDTSITASKNFGSALSSTSSPSVFAPLVTTLSGSDPTPAVSISILSSSLSSAIGTAAIVSGAEFKESTSLITTSTTTITSTTTYTPAFAITTALTIVEPVLSSPSNASHSTITISTCLPTVLYSTITILPVSTGTVSLAYNTSTPLATSSPLVFTGVAPTIKASLCAGILLVALSSSLLL